MSWFGVCKLRFTLKLTDVRSKSVAVSATFATGPPLHLSYLTDYNPIRYQLNRWDAQDFAITQLRKFASERNVHVTIVIHPRKVRLIMSARYTRCPNGCSHSQDPQS